MTNELSIYKNGNFHLKEQNIDKGFKEGYVSITVSRINTLHITYHYLLPLHVCQIFNRNNMLAKRIPLQQNFKMK